MHHDYNHGIVDCRDILSVVLKPPIFHLQVCDGKEIYEVDLEPFRDLQGLLSNVTNSLNQIDKRVNQTGIIYRDDIEDMKKFIEKFSKELWDIHSLLLKRTKEVSED
jgi:hypothetical protein